MKRILFISIFIILALCTPINCTAAEINIEEKLNTEGLYDTLGESNKEDLSKLGITSVSDTINFSWGNIFTALVDTAKDKYTSPLKTLLFISVIIIISSFLSSYNSDSDGICGLAGTLAVCTLIVPHISTLIAETKTVCEVISVFLLAAIPIYCSLLIASGNFLTGSGYGGTSIIAANLLSQISKGVVIPSLSIFLGLSISSAFAHINIKSISESVYKLVKWLMIFAVTAFSSIISVQAAVSGAADSATSKTVKLLASTAIPIIGGALGDGVSAVQNSIKILKSGASAFGIIATITIFLSPVIQTLLWMYTCQISIIISELFNATKIKEFLYVNMIVLKMILAVLLSLCIISIVTAAITLFVGA